MDSITEAEKKFNSFKDAFGEFNAQYTNIMTKANDILHRARHGLPVNSEEIDSLIKRSLQLEQKIRLIHVSDSLTQNPPDNPDFLRMEKIKLATEHMIDQTRKFTRALSGMQESLHAVLIQKRNLRKIAEAAKKKKTIKPNKTRKWKWPLRKKPL